MLRPKIILRKVQNLNILIYYPQSLAYLCGELYPSKWSRPTHNTVGLLQEKHIGQLYFQIFCFPEFYVNIKHKQNVSFSENIYN